MALPLRLPLPFNNSIPVQYVAPWGDDSNDGQDGFLYPKKTFLAAYDFAFSRFGSCEFHVANGTYTGGANQYSPIGTVSVPGQGIWLDGSRLVNVNAPLYPGCRVAMPHAIIGYVGPADGSPTTQPQFEFPVATILPGLPGDVTKPSARFDVGYWLTNNFNASLRMRNIAFQGHSIAVRLAVNQNPAGNPDLPANRTTAETVAVCHFDQCGFVATTHGGGDINEGPLIDMGYYLWVYFNQCALNASQDNALTSDRRSAMLVKPGDGSCLLNLTACRGLNGGITYYCGPSTWGAWVDNYLVESNGANLPAAVKIVGPGARGNAILNNVSTADAGGGSEPVIDISGPADEFLATQVIVGAQVTTRGPCVLTTASPDAAYPITDFNKSRKMGFVQGKIWGDTDAGRWGSPPVAARWRNMIPSHTDAGGLTGPLSAQPHDESTNCIYTARGASGAHGVNADVRDKFGGFSAFRLASGNGSVASCCPFRAAAFGVAQGERFAVGAWIRPASGRALNDTGPLLNLGFLFQPPATTITYANMSSGDLLRVFHGDGEWQWYAGGLTFSTLTGPADMTCQLTAYADHGETNHPIEVCGLTLIRIPAGEITDNEFGQLIQSFPMMPQASPGFVGTQPGQVIAASGGFATGNRVAIGAHVIGAVNGYMHIYDMDTGADLGVIEIKNLTS